MQKVYFVYIIECRSGRYYTGYTVDLNKRFDEHASGRNGAKYTRSFKPEKILASWEISGTRGDAMKVESFIKSLTKNEKVAITGSPEILADRVRVVKDLNCEIKVYDCKNSTGNA
jgi:putative endonuclease